MPNPKPKQTQPFIDARFQPKAGEAMGKVIGTRYPLIVQEALERIENPQDYIRAAVLRQLQEDGLIE